VIYALAIGTGNCPRYILKSHINEAWRTKLDPSCRRRIHFGVRCSQEVALRAVTEHLWKIVFRKCYYRHAYKHL